VISFAINLNFNGPAIVWTEPASRLKRPPSTSSQALPDKRNRFSGSAASALVVPRAGFRGSSIHQPVLAFLETIGGSHDSTTLPFPAGHNTLQQATLMTFASRTHFRLR
jgi:hypothetical protein